MKNEKLNMTGQGRPMHMAQCLVFNFTFLILN